MDTAGEKECVTSLLCQLFPIKPALCDFHHVDGLLVPVDAITINIVPLRRVNYRRLGEMNER